MRGAVYNERLTRMLEDRVEEALAAIEQATGKIDVLLSRNPATALIPVNVQVNVIDTAPQDGEDIAFLKNTGRMAWTRSGCVLNLRMGCCASPFRS